MTRHPFNESHDHQSPAGQRLEQRHREQLSALVDGELGADEARFLLRRMEHDPELGGCQERWQLLGDVMRGQASLLAPAGFSAAVAAAISAEPAPQTDARRQVRRSGWRAWGGGALAASVAAVALFLGREKLQEAPVVDEPATQVVASQAQLPPAPVQPAAVTEASVATAAMTVASAPAVAVAAAGRRQEARRASATRTQQAARVAQRDDAPLRAVASQAPLTPTVPAAAPRHLPFGEVSGLQARPWPRSSLAPAAGGALNASFPAATGGAAFYPFEPRLQDDLPASQRPRD